MMLDLGPNAEPGLPGSESGPGGPSLATGVSIAFSTVTVASGESGFAEGTDKEQSVASEAPDAGEAGGAVAIALGDALEGMVSNQVMIVGATGAADDVSITSAATWATSPTWSPMPRRYRNSVNGPRSRVHASRPR